MSDRRLTPANTRVAAQELRGQVAAEAFVAGEDCAVSAPLADLRAAPEGARDRQLNHGARFRVLERRGGWAFGQAGADGYCGYVREGDLGVDFEPSHIIAVRASHLYPAPEVKSEAAAALSFGARLRILDESGAFAQTDTGFFVPKAHLRRAERPFSDPATIAQLFFGTPYLWGGNSAFGIDCSGLVQAAFLACAIPCPGDSDMQVALGEGLDPGAVLARGDLLFWAGHVAMAVDPDTLIHANAHHMAVAYEPVEKAIQRIKAQGGGEITARRRISVISKT